MKIIRAVLPNAVIVLSGIFIVFLILDGFNPTMDFTGNKISSVLLALLCIASSANAILFIHDERKK